MAGVTKDSKWSWVVAVACCCCHCMLHGVTRLSGMLLIHFVQNFHVNRTLASLPFSVCNSAMFLCGPIVGFIGQRFGFRAVTVTGCIFASAGVGLCFFSTDILLTTVFWGILFGIGNGLGTTMLPHVINQNFDKYLSTASGISYSGAYMGSFILPPIVNMALEKYGFSGFFLFLSGIMLQSIVAAMFFRTPSRRRTSPNWDQEKSRSTFFRKSSAIRDMIAASVGVVTSSAHSSDTLGLCFEDSCVKSGFTAAAKVDDRQTTPRKLSSSPSTSCVRLSRSLESKLDPEQNQNAQKPGITRNTDVKQPRHQCDPEDFDGSCASQEKVFELPGHVIDENPDLVLIPVDLIKMGNGNSSFLSETVGWGIRNTSALDRGVFANDPSSCCRTYHVNDSSTPQPQQKRQRHHSSPEAKFFTRPQARKFASSLRVLTGDSASKRRKAQIQLLSCKHLGTEDATKPAKDKLVEDKQQKQTSIDDRNCSADEFKKGKLSVARSVPFDFRLSRQTEGMKSIPSPATIRRSIKKRFSLDAEGLRPLFTDEFGKNGKKDVTSASFLFNISEAARLSRKSSKTSKMEPDPPVDSINIPIEGVDTEKTSASSEDGRRRNCFLTWIDVFLNPIFVIISLTFSLYFFIRVCIFTIVGDYAKDIGTPDEGIPYAVMALSTADLVGTLCLGWVTDKKLMTRRYYISLCFVIMAVALTSMPFSDDFVKLLIAISIYGVFESSALTMFPLLIAHYIPADKQAVSIASNNLLVAPTMLLVSVVIGYFRDTLGSYIGLFYLLAGVSSFCSFVWIVLPSYLQKHQQSDQESES